MTTILIGHRGVGKTTFLEALKGYARKEEIPCLCIDLDEKIEGEVGVSITELWRNGEAAFRKLERATLEKIMARPSKVSRIISVGAGFEGPLPAGASVLWLRRETDGDGRVFLSRPRLNPEISPFAEYMQRFGQRQDRFKSWAFEQLVLPEGYVHGLEHFVLNPCKIHAPFDFTLKPGHFHDWPAFWAKRSHWNVRRFELRDDLLSPQQMELARETIPAERLIYSLRNSTATPVEFTCDWALELGEPPPSASILSRHERQGDFSETLRLFADFGSSVLKLAVPVENFHELELGHQWWLQDPHKRAFLPRSKDGRWRWYRSLFGPRMPIHFYREDEGSALDQPLLWQTQLQPELGECFAAVLGSPVHHSRSPLEHLEFFKARHMPFVAIDIPAGEFPKAFAFLRKLGLTHAAVTSPLKQVAEQVCSSYSEEAQALGAVNTLRIQGDEVEGHNTDVLALRELKEEFGDAKEVWLWGGRGVRSSIKAVWPEVKEVAARQGSMEGGHPDLLIWATGRTNDFQWPSSQLRPARVFDLNYSDSSPGLEWAAVNNLPYQSGLKMFKLQAEFQRRIWRR